MTKIPVVNSGWNLNMNTCPCDIDLIDYLQDKPQPYSLFHMGCGLHHSVGKWAATQPGVCVRSISLTPLEIFEYIELATNNPILNKHYLVDFGDIHLIDFRLLPISNYVSLFHLGEIWEQTKDYQNGKSIKGVLRGFIKHNVREIYFFPNSVGWKVLEPIIAETEIARWYPSTHKSIKIYRRPIP